MSNNNLRPVLFLKPIPGFDGYFLDILCQIRSIKRPAEGMRILKWRKWRKREYVQFWLQGKGRTHRTKDQIVKMTKSVKWIKWCNGKILEE